MVKVCVSSPLLEGKGASLAGTGAFKHKGGVLLGLRAYLSVQLRRWGVGGSVVMSKRPAPNVCVRASWNQILP